jgi:hypothetical protein
VEDGADTIGEGDYHELGVIDCPSRSGIFSGIPATNTRILSG